MCICDTATGHHLLDLIGHQAAVESIVFSPDGQSLASGSRDKTVKYWDLSPILVQVADDSSEIQSESSRPAREIQRTANFVGHVDSVVAVAVSHDGQWIISGSQDREIRIWDLKSGESLCSLYGKWVWSKSPNL